MAYVSGLSGIADELNAAIAAAISRGAPPDVVAEWRSIVSDDTDPSWLGNINAWKPGLNAYGVAAGGGSWLNQLLTPDNVKVGTQVASTGLQTLLSTFGIGPKPAAAPPPAALGMSTSNKVALVGGVAVIAVAAYVIATKKKKG